MNQIIKTITRLSILSAALVGGPAHAADKKVYPGLMCIVESGNITRSSSGYIYNTSPITPLVVLCPIVRDDTDSSWLSLHVNVRDYHNADAVYCQGWSKQKDAAAKGATGMQNSGNAFTGSIDLSLGGGVSSSTDGFFFLRCTIPVQPGAASPPSGINSYRIEEDVGP